jgi:hypothetical protein
VSQNPAVLDPAPRDVTHALSLHAVCVCVDDKGVCDRNNKKLMCKHRRSELCVFVVANERAGGGRDGHALAPRTGASKRQPRRPPLCAWVDSTHSSSCFVCNAKYHGLVQGGALAVDLAQTASPLRDTCSVLSPVYAAPQHALDYCKPTAGRLLFFSVASSYHRCRSFASASLVVVQFIVCFALRLGFDVGDRSVGRSLVSAHVLVAN